MTNFLILLTVLVVSRASPLDKIQQFQKCWNQQAFANFKACMNKVSNSGKEMSLENMDPFLTATSICVLKEAEVVNEKDEIFFDKHDSYVRTFARPENAVALADCNKPCKTDRQAEAYLKCVRPCYEKTDGGTICTEKALEQATE